MENTMYPTGDKAEAPLTQLKSDFGNGARHVKDAATGEIKNLIADVEDLVARVADVKDPDLIRVRNKVTAALVSARDSVVNGTEAMRQQARQVAGTADDYVRASPWQALGVAALVGAAFGYLAGRRQ